MCPQCGAPCATLICLYCGAYRRSVERFPLGRLDIYVTQEIEPVGWIDLRTGTFVEHPARTAARLRGAA